MIGSRGVADWCIDRPVATLLLTVAMLLLGVFAFRELPVAPLPEADFPTIRINADLPGAGPETMASAVATPLETLFSAIPGVVEMTSTSALGSTSILLQFDLDKDIDVAAQEVQAAISSAMSRLPADLPSPPRWSKVNPADSPVVVLWMQSPLMTLTALSDLAETVVARQLTQIAGVAEVNITGQQKPAIRIQASPERLAALGLTMADIRAAVRAASTNQPKGALFGAGRVSTLESNDQLMEPGEYDRIVLAERDGAAVLLRDVARVSIGPENAYVEAWQYGRPGLQLIVSRQPGANIVATSGRIQAALPGIQELLPATVELGVLNDRTRTIRASLAEVELTLGFTVALVILIIGLFLRRLSATLIVAAVLVTALVGTFAAMYLLGFSLNNLTLMALVIAVGFVVDDAIVVIENIHRHIEHGVPGREAAVRGTAEIAFTVVSISLSLIAAFIPLLFMGGVIGRLLQEFAVTVAAAILISMVVSLTLAPMLAARFPGAGVAAPDRSGFGPRVADAYARSLRWTLARPALMLGGFALTIVLAVAGYVYLPKGFFPLQDTAFILGSSQAAQDISYDDMRAKHAALAEIVARDPAVQAYAHSIGATGGSQSMATGRFWLILKDRGDRDESAAGVINRLRPQLAAVPGVTLSLRIAQDINVRSGPSRAQYQYALRGSDSEEVARWTEELTARLTASPEFRDVSNDQETGASVVRLDIDREAAARFGLTSRDVDDLLYDAFGQRQIAEFQTERNQYKVVLELEPGQRGQAASLAWLHLRSPATGAMVPLSAFATVAPPAAGPLSISHNGMFPAANISFNLAPGVALGDVVRRVESLAAEIGMPDSVSGTFQGTAQAFQDSLESQPVLILAAILAVYIILGVLYESFIHPLTILSTLPSAGLGAVLLLWLWGQDFTIIALIGVVLLIGIVKKNGILVVDFAIAAQRREGLDATEAIYQACLARFRPILMTTLAATLGAVPLMLGFGTGSELRQPLGIAVVGGLLLSQVLTLYSTPAVYVALDRLSRWRPGRQSSRRRGMTRDPAAFPSGS